MLDGHLEDYKLQVSTRPGTITLLDKESLMSDEVQGPVRYILPSSSTTSTDIV